MKFPQEKYPPPCSLKCFSKCSRSRDQNSRSKESRRPVSPHAFVLPSWSSSKLTSMLSLRTLPHLLCANSLAAANPCFQRGQQRRATLQASCSSRTVICMHLCLRVNLVGFLFLKGDKKQNRSHFGVPLKSQAHMMLIFASPSLLHLQSAPVFLVLGTSRHHPMATRGKLGPRTCSNTNVAACSGHLVESLHNLFQPCGRGSKIGTQNGTLVNGTKD